MRILVLCFALFNIISFGQDLKKIQKKYRIENCGDSDYLIVDRKGKTGIYNQKKQSFTIALSESQFFFLNKYDILFEFTEDHKVIARDLFSQDFPNAALTSSEHNYLMYQKETYYENRSGDYYLSNGKLHTENLNTGRIEMMQDSTLSLSQKILDLPEYHKLTFGVERKDNFLIVSDLLNDSYNPNPIPLASLEYPGEDSINENAETVYPPEDKGYQQTGVYDLESREWVIAPEYFRILLLNDIIFCNKQDSFNDEIYFPGYGHWDIFKINDGLIEPIKMDVSWASEIPLEELFDGDAFDFAQKDSSYIQFTKNGKKGLLRLSLFYNTDYLNPGEPAYSSLSLYHDSLIPADYSLIANIGDALLEPEYFLLNENGIKYVNLNGDDLVTNITANERLSIRDYGTKGNDTPEFTYWILDKSTYKQKGIDSLELVSKKVENPGQRLMNRRSIERLNDSLIYLEYWIKQGTYWQPVYGDDYYEPMVNENGDELFYPPDPGEFKSGIFNLKTNHWLYDRSYAWLTMSDDNFQICFPDLDSAGYYTTYLFKIDDLNLKTIEQEEKPDQIKMNFIDRLPKYKADTIYSILGATPSYMGYFETNNKMGLYYKGYPEIITDPCDYTYFNNEFNYHFSIDNEELSMNMFSYDTVISVQELNKISLLPAENINPSSGDLYVRIESDKKHVVIHVKDEKSYSKIDFDKNSFDAYSKEAKSLLNWHFSVNKINDSLIYIEDWLADESKNDILPLMSELYPGEDSLDANGEWVYPPLQPGYYRSGVYNIQSKKWFFDRQYYKIDFAEDQFFLSSPLLSDEGLLDTYQFKIINLSKEIIWDGKDDNEIPDESPFFGNRVDD